MESEKEVKEEKTPIKMGLVDGLLILMVCVVTALGIIYFVMH